MRVAEAQQLVAIAYRQAMLKSVRRVIVAALVALPLAALVRPSWVLALVGLLAAVGLSMFLVSDAASKVRRITGLPEPVQSKLWHRFRTDAPFALRVKVALANDGLSRALDEITRSINARDAVANVRDVLQKE
jgi:hypothetical protein